MNLLFSPKDPKEQLDGLSIISKLGRRKPNRHERQKGQLPNSIRLMQLGAGVEVVRAMRVHEKDVRVMTAACTAIKHLGGNLFTFLRSVGDIKANVDWELALL